MKKEKSMPGVPDVPDMIRSALICLSGLDTQEFVDRAVAHVSKNHLLVLLYVLDTRPAEELGYIARRLQAGTHAMAGREAAMSAADEETAVAVLNAAKTRFAQRGFDHGRTTLQVRRGRPEQEIVKVASQQELDIGLVVIGSSYKGGPRPAIGPASVGHVARFVLDHAPCDVLLLR
jgi:nucleotide-binding universal stress UspA family protein